MECRFIVIVLIQLLRGVCLHKIPPNIIFILADDFGWNDVSFHGSPQIPTANLDALAFSGVILHNYYVQPLCTPSRSSLMTGKHPIHTGLQHDVLYGSQKYGLPLKEKLLPNYLSSLGYENHIVGKWHLGHFTKEYTPLYRGFRSHYGYWTGHQDYYDHTAVEGQMWGYDMRRNLSIDWSAFGRYTTRLITQEACTVIEKHDISKPLFLYVAHLAVHSANSHTPLQAPKKTVDMFSYIKDVPRRHYAAMVHELDQSVGYIVETLNRKNMLKNSIIVFSTDNGGPAAGFNQNAASNWPLKGVKNTPWEGGVRATGFVWSPLIPVPRHGQIMEDLMDVTDWVPTLYEAAGGNVLELDSLDGISHWKTILYDVPSLRDHVLHNIDDISGYAAIRKGKWKLVKGTTYNGDWDNWYGPSGRDNTSSPNDVESFDRSDLYLHQLNDSYVGRCLSTIGMKFPSNLNEKRNAVEISCGDRPIHTIPCKPLQEPCLFNVIDDPCEYNNVAQEFPGITNDLTDLLQFYNSSAVQPLNMPADPASNPKFWNYTWTNWVDFL